VGQGHVLRCRTWSESGFGSCNSMRAGFCGGFVLEKELKSPSAVTQWRSCFPSVAGAHSRRCAPPVV